MKGTTGKRCGCRDRHGRPLGATCPKLTRANGTWNPNHGLWQYQIELPPTTDGRRRPLRKGGYDTQAAAEAELDQIRRLLTIPTTGDTEDLTRVGDLIDTCLKTGQGIPTPERAQQALHLADTTPITLGQWLTQWLAGKRDIGDGTRRSYAGHIRLHLNPHLGHIRLDKLRVGHLDTMIEAIEERNELIETHRNSPHASERHKVHGMRTVGPTTLHSVRATLRKALNDAQRAGRITHNPATQLQLPPTKRPKPLLWTDERVSRWRDTGEIPGPVMVWTPTQTGAFLDHTYKAQDPLYALYHLIAYRGLRRGEACGLHWTDVDLDNAQLAVRWQIVQLGWQTAMKPPKTDSSEDIVALDTQTIAALRTHRKHQRAQRHQAGPTWTDTGLVFTTPTGTPLHPADVTHHLRHLIRQTGLPPIRLHDLRHGAATLVLQPRIVM